MSNKTENYVFLCLDVGGEVVAIFKHSQPAVVYCMENLYIFHAINKLEKIVPQVGDYLILDL